MTLVGDDRELFARSLAHAVESSDVDAALTDLGWHEALVDDRRTAVSLLFELQGRTGAVSSALDAVMGGSYLVPGTTALDPAFGWRAVSEVPVEALAAGRLALAHELVGASLAMLELARVHALERVQFDRPIAQFQAVRHKLAETLVAVEGADGACAAGWELGTPVAATAAKALAGRAARVAARHGQQVLAGIGFTMEHPFHRFLRRALVLDRLLGDSRSLTAELGERLLTTGQVPELVSL